MLFDRSLIAEPQSYRSRPASGASTAPPLIGPQGEVWPPDRHLQLEDIHGQKQTLTLTLKDVRAYAQQHGKRAELDQFVRDQLGGSHNLANIDPKQMDGHRAAFNQMVQRVLEPAKQFVLPGGGGEVKIGHVDAYVLHRMNSPGRPTSAKDVARSADLDHFLSLAQAGTLKTADGQPVRLGEGSLQSMAKDSHEAEGLRKQFQQLVEFSAENKQIRQSSSSYGNTPTPPRAEPARPESPTGLVRSLGSRLSRWFGFGT